MAILLQTRISKYQGKFALQNTKCIKFTVIHCFKMEIVNPCFSVLSNYEVMESLKSIKDTKKKYGLRNLATITYETLQFLEDSPCKHQNRESILAFIEEMQQYKLTTNECLMMVNDPPSSALHIQLLVEDSEERLTEEQVNNIIEIAKKHFPGPAQESS